MNHTKQSLNFWHNLIYKVTENNPVEAQPLRLFELGGFILYLCFFLMVSLFCSWIISSKVLIITSISLFFLLLFVFILYSNSIILKDIENNNKNYQIWKPLEYVTEKIYNISELYILIIILGSLLYGIYSLIKFFIGQ